jgi:hypothetical protein
METRIYRSAKHALLVSREDIEGTAEFVRRRYARLEFSAHCTDGSTLTTKNADEILNFENRNDRRIDELKLEFRQDDITERGDIQFSDEGFRLCRWTVWSNDDGFAQQIATELGQRVRASRPWYSWIIRIRPTAVFVGFLLLLSATLTWGYLLKTGHLPSTEHPSPDFAEIFNVLLPILVILGLCLLLAEKVWSWMFPKLWFLIGRQTREFEKRERVRRLVFGGVIGAIVIGLIVNYLSAIFLSQRR